MINPGLVGIIGHRFFELVVMDILPFFLDEDDFVLNMGGAALEVANPVAENIMPQNRPEVIRNQNYFEEIIPLYTNEQFREHFRMSKESFEVQFSSYFWKLCKTNYCFQVLLNHIARVHNNQNEHICLRKKLMATV